MKPKLNICYVNTSQKEIYIKFTNDGAVMFDSYIKYIYTYIYI